MITTAGRAGPNAALASILTHSVFSLVRQEGRVSSQGIDRPSPSILKRIDERIAKQEAKHEESMLRITGSSFGGDRTGGSSFQMSMGSANSSILLPPV